MKNSISIHDFIFEFKGYGHYKVTYTSPVTGKKWDYEVDDMTIIDATKNTNNPKKKDLEILKNYLKYKNKQR